MENVVGRKAEVNELMRLYESGRPEFVAVYGRRRVGKTYLIKETFNGLITFQHSGVSPVDQDDEKNRMKTQLESFYYSLLNHGLEGYKMPKTWLEAFFQLEQLLKRLDDGSRQLVFLDELPWMDTPKSGFLSAFESFWNGWCNGRNNMMLVVCGSATAWMTNNLSRSKGGFYGRLTDEIKLSPFTLKECEDYFKTKGMSMSRYDMVQSYMVFGGIPYYLSYFNKELSLSQNIDQLLFGKKPRLKDEYYKMFNSIFTNAEDCRKIIACLAKRHYGFMREEIAKMTGLPLGGNLSQTLKALAESDFIVKYVPFGKSKREEHYKLVDNFSLFWLKYVEGNETTAFWQENKASDILDAWKGVAFEEVCFEHVEQIKEALHIGGVNANISAWALQSGKDEKGAQLDLLIDRADNVINLCEMKFCTSPYSIDNEEEQKLNHRIEVLKKAIPPHKSIHLTMITTRGIASGVHNDIVQKSVTIDDLFV